jgi:hypothetical protein
MKNEWAGLGDFLSQSTIPEIFTRMGYDVYMSNKQPFSNEGIKELVMHNPYIKGFAEEDADLVYLSDRWYYCPITNTHRPYPYDECDNTNHIARIEHMIFGKYYNNYPKLYYNPVFKSEWKDVTFVDMKYSSALYSGFGPYLHPIDTYLEYVFRNNTNIVIQGKNYQTTSIWEYIDIIFSCKKFICTFSGSSIVASSINAHNTECVMSKEYLEDRFYRLGKTFTFNNIKYTGV